MGQLHAKIREMSGRTLFLGHDPNSSHRPNFDPDERWSNLYREREKNHIYKWVGPRAGLLFKINFENNKI